VHKLSSASILFNAEMAARIADQAVQIHGGYGYMLEYPVQRFFEGRQTTRDRCRNL